MESLYRGRAKTKPNKTHCSKIRQYTKILRCSYIKSLYNLVPKMLIVKDAYKCAHTHAYVPVRIHTELHCYLVCRGFPMKIVQSGILTMETGVDKSHSK